MMNRPDAEDEFLAKGVLSYSDVQAAIREFERLVRERWRSVLAKAMPAIGRSMRINMADAEFGDLRYVWNKGASVGLKWQDGGGYTHEFYLWWYEGRCRAVASVEAPDTKTAKALAERVRKTANKNRIEQEACEVYICREVPKDIAEFDTVLERILADWSEVWQLAGGLNAARSARA
jgi:hypothetical protein